MTGGRLGRSTAASAPDTLTSCAEEPLHAIDLITNACPTASLLLLLSFTLSVVDLLMGRGLL